MPDAATPVLTCPFCHQATPVLLTREEPVGQLFGLPPLQLMVRVQYCTDLSCEREARTTSIQSVSQLRARLAKTANSPASGWGGG